MIPPTKGPSRRPKLIAHDYTIKALIPKVVCGFEIKEIVDKSSRLLGSFGPLMRGSLAF